MKKIIMLLVVLSTTISSFAQFEQGKYYVGAGLSGLDMNYSGANKFNFGFEAKVGYIVYDNWMLLAQFGYEHKGNDEVGDCISAGISGRYYIIQNGLYLGVNTKLIHANHNYNDLMPGIELGYAFFLNKSVTIEPAIYYDQSFKRHSDFSTIGLRLGIGVYL